MHISTPISIVQSILKLLFMGSSETSIRELDFGASFAINAGTVGVDPLEKKVLLVQYNPKNEYLLPQGRKDFGETLHRTAVRGTKEETGYEVVLRPHDTSTQATTPRGAFDPIWHEEPFAVQQRVRSEVGREIVFWYLATGSSLLQELSYIKDPELAKDFQPHWVDYASALKLLKFEDHRKVVKKALQILGTSV